MRSRSRFIPLLCLMLALGVVNQEIAIPKVADALLADRDDPVGDKMLPVQGAFERFAAM